MILLVYILYNMWPEWQNYENKTETWKKYGQDLNSFKWTVTAYITSNYPDKISNWKIDRKWITELRKKDKKLDNLIKSYLEPWEKKVSNTRNSLKDLKQELKMTNEQVEAYNKQEISYPSFNEKELIEAWVFNISWEELDVALSDPSRTKTINRMELYKDPGVYINTPRQEWYEQDSTTFQDLIKERGGDEKITHTTIDKEFSYTNQEWREITQNITYDVYIRPGSKDIYVLPTPESIKIIKEGNNSQNWIIDSKTTPGIWYWGWGNPWWWWWEF